MQRHKRMGVVVVGDELLSGKRQDRHLARVIEALQPRGMQVAWCRYAGDDIGPLSETLRQTQIDEVPVLCFGGIGATPDDQTRQAAAKAFGVNIVRHAQAAALIEKQFGKDAYPNRIRMAELPEDCLLIPNSINLIPGFTLYEHHFFPGFPQMAWPMLEWVLDTYYPQRGPVSAECSVRVRETTESNLYDLMERVSARHLKIRLFSLPHMGNDNYIELGVRGDRGNVEKAFADLVSELNARKLPFDVAVGC